MTSEQDRLEAADWRLLSAVDRREREGSSFEIPERTARTSLRVGDGAKLLFELRTGIERMWVVVVERRAGGYLGRLISTPAEEDAPVAPGLDLEFGPDHVAAIDEPPIEFLEREFGREFVDRLTQSRMDEPGPESGGDRWALWMVSAVAFLLLFLFDGFLLEVVWVVVSGVKMIFGR